MNMDWRTEGMSDLAKQGFMKPRKQKMITKYRVWCFDMTGSLGDFVSAVCTTKESAETNRRLAGAEFLRFETFRELD